jgi:DNA-binding GntR family transcriptional regulator
MLGVSRTPVREALRLLVARGLLVSRHGRGVAVAVLTPKQVAEVLELRSCLESFALKLAIPRMDKSDHQALRAAFQAMDEAAARGDARGFEERDDRFHRLIYLAAANDTLFSMVDGLVKQIRMMRAAVLSIPGELSASQQFHAALLDAIERGDVARAVALREEALEADKAKLVAAMVDSGEQAGSAPPRRHGRTQ